MANDPKPPEKKSETIEIRVPLNVKTALKEKAAMEKKSVSEALRELINTHLLDEDRRLPRQRISLGWLSSAILAIAGFGLFSTAMATAGTIKLNVDGAFKDHTQPVLKSAVFSQPMQLEDGQEQSFVVGDPDDGFRMSIIATEQDEDYIFVQIKIFDALDHDAEAMVNPRLLIERGKGGTIDIDNGQGKSYLMTIKPSD